MKILGFHKRIGVTLVLAIILGNSSLAFSDESLVFIVNLKNTATTISAQDLKDYYYKKKRSWPDGTSVRFIDRVNGSLRKMFLTDILKATAEELDLFWIGQKLYSGNSAPLQESSDSLVIQFVNSFDGGVGYVSSSTPINSKKVKAIQVE